MATATNFNATLDGVNPFNDFSGTPIAWSGGYIEKVGINDDIADDVLNANFTLSGSNWAITRFEVGAVSGDGWAGFNDNAPGTGRFIEDLVLETDSTVDLMSTQVERISGAGGHDHQIQIWGGNQGIESILLDGDTNQLGVYDGSVGYVRTAGNDVLNAIGGTIGAAYTQEGNDTVTVGQEGGIDLLDTGTGADAVTVQGNGTVRALFAEDGSDTVLVKENGYIGSLDMTGGGSHVTIEGNGSVDALKANGLGDLVYVTTTGSATLGSYHAMNAMSRLDLGDGGAGEVILDAVGPYTQQVYATGHVGYLRVEADQYTSVRLGPGGAGTIILSGAGDFVRTDTGLVETIRTGGGGDSLFLGTGGAEVVRLGEGDDGLYLGDRPADQLMIVRGGLGTDRIGFNDASGGVTFSLASDSLQNPGAPGGDLAAAGTGFIWARGFEDLFGSGFDDGLTGSGDDNRLYGLDGDDQLSGLGGADMILGGAGDDVLRGGGGTDDLFGDEDNDKLFGGAGADTLDGGDGKDRLFGGGGNDVLAGGAGNDILKGQAGADVFAFGPDGGTDHVLDYNKRADTIQIEGHDGGFGDLRIFSRGGDLRIVYDGGLIILDDMAGVKLHAADFDFV